ncbi:hypothetical protein [Celeribacter indicus]|uniref:Uncharacterized protein n=1 Tax=Celeribacter indicus TaxID=1208324 RepID=A0A0B5DVH7_9RHOB|nr:hypothetical protein [Celeribacter indicus]AJE44756.1 hypothetical protein P73_0041 [Celeribacter indicus]SDX50299.1 hypothetical protein SAMN05443573_13425 [Celeribacter indicus]
MEKLTLLLNASTVEMLHLLARDSGKTIGLLVQDMALERYMNCAMSGTRPSGQAAPSGEIGLTGSG